MAKELSRRLLSVNMKRLRTKQLLSGDELAEKSKITGTSVRRIETLRQWPTPAVLDAIARALRVPIADLFLESKKTRR